MHNDTRSIRCSDRELFYLSALIGGETLLGVRDPFPGWLIEEIQDAMTDVQRALSERKVITIQPRGVVVADKDVEALVSVVALCDAMLITTLATSRQEAWQRTFYFKGATAVELASAEGNEEYSISQLDGQVESIAEEIASWWKLANQPAAEGKPIRTEENVLTQARHLTVGQGANNALDYLVGTGISKDSARPLAETFASASKNGVVVMLRRRVSAWQTGSVGMLESNNGLWHLRSFDQAGQAMIECIPCSAPMLRAELRNLFAHFARS